MALLTAALARWSGITTWMREWPRRSQVHEPFVHGHLRRPERLFVNDRLLPFIHFLIDRRSRAGICSYVLTLKPENKVATLSLAELRRIPADKISKG